MRETVYVADANILIDLIDLGLGARWTDHFRCVTSVEVLGEVEYDRDDERSAWLRDEERVGIHVLSEPQAKTAQDLQVGHAALSYPDCTVVVIAQRGDLTVLSGDGPMRKKAKQFGIRLHGLLYVLHELVALGELSPLEAVDQCRRWQETNPRTPTSKCEAYCRRWEAMG